MKKKKLMLGLGSIAAIAGPVAAVISCGSGGGVGRYDTENDGKLKLATTFSSTGLQSKAISTILDTYNEYVAKVKKDLTDLPAKIKALEAELKGETTKVAAKKSEIINATLNIADDVEDDGNDGTGDGTGGNTGGDAGGDAGGGDDDSTTSDGTDSNVANEHGSETGEKPAIKKPATQKPAAETVVKTPPANDKTDAQKKAELADYKKRLEFAKSYANDLMPFDEQVTISGGYGAVIKQLRAKFTAKDKKTIYNGVFDYPASAAILKSYGMQLDLSKAGLTTEESDAIKNRFDKEYWKQNDLIGGLETGGVYTIPVSLSSVANAINKPLLGYILTQVKTKAAKLYDINNTSELNVAAGVYLKDDSASYDADSDLATIKNLWGELDGTKLEENLKAEGFSETNKVDDSILKEWDTLIKFAVAVQKSFITPHKVNESKVMALLAFDAPTNVIQLLSFAFANGNINDFYITKDSEGYVEQTYLKDKESNSFKNFKKTIELLKKGIDAGAIWLGGQGAYGSPFLMQHQAMMSFGSTAGASHWYEKDASITVKGFANIKIEGLKKDILTTPLEESPSLKIEGEEISPAALEFYDGKHTSKVNTTDKAGKYDLIWADNVTSDKAKKTLVTHKKAFISKTEVSGDEHVLIAKSKDETKLKYKKFLYLTSNAIPTETTEATKLSFLDKEKATVFGKYNTKFVTYDKKDTAGTHDIVLLKGQTLEALKDDLTTKGYTAIIKIHNTVKADFVKKYPGDIIKELGATKSVVDTGPDKAEWKTQSRVYLFKGGNGNIEVKKDGQVLGQNEVVGILPPTKIKGKEKGGIYVQGPSLIGIHANTPEDKAYALFVKWFTGTDKYEFKDGKKTITDTPLNFWMTKAQYITPIKGVFGKDSAIKKAIDAGKQTKKSYNWLGVGVAFDIFKQANDNLLPIIQPIDDFSGIARNDVTDPIVKSIYTDAHSSANGLTESFDDIYDRLGTFAKSSHII